MNNGVERRALVTGGTDGIGKSVAKELACRGVQVLIVGRDSVKGVAAERELRGATGNESVTYLQADLSLMDEARNLVREVGSRWPQLDYLVHGAGVIRGSRHLTSEGIELQFATNYLSRFVLTNELLPLLVAAGPAPRARVLLLSGAAQGGKIHFEDVNLAHGFNLPRVVAQFCCANDVFTLELARRVPSVTVICLKIGVVKTNIRKGFPLWMRLLVTLLFDPLIGQTPQEVADVVLPLLLDVGYEGASGRLFLKVRKFKVATPSAYVSDPERGAALWKLSRRLSEGELSVAERRGS